MGTSTSNRGQNGRTPLIPSWLDNENEINNDDCKILPPVANPERFREPRGNFTRYVNSLGRNGAYLNDALSKYVRNSLGGEKNAVKRLGTAMLSTVRLLSIIRDISNNGIENVSREFGLGDLVGKNAKDVFLEIIEFVCPDGGSVDEGIARNSYIETIETMTDLSLITIENMSNRQFLLFTEIYMANVIKDRLINDIGNKLIKLPSDINSVETIEQQLIDFIQGAVSDAIVKLKIDIKKIKPDQTRNIVNSIYENSYSILKTIGED